MLTSSQIVTHLQEQLPFITDQFHDMLSVTSGSVLNGILTIVFPEPHGLIVGEQVNINDAIIRNKIINIIINSDNSVSYITENVHDLTAYSSEGHGNTWPQGLSVRVETPTGAETIALIPDSSAVPHNTEFVGIEGSPVYDLVDDYFLLENRSYGVAGIKEVYAVVDEETIEIDLSDVPDVPNGDLIMTYLLTNVRVCAVANLDRAKEIYTSQSNNKPWLFVVMLDRKASKDRRNDDDLVSLPESSYRLLNIIQEYSILTILPTENNLSGNDAKDFAYEDLFIILNQCLYGWEGSGYIGDGEVEYNTSTYSHSYAWQARQQIDWSDGYINGKTTAYRSQQITQTIFDNGVSDANIEY